MTDPFNKLKPESLSIHNLMASFYYEVPHNQREFSWRSNQEIKQFWDDLVDTIKRDRENGATRSSPLGHFLGAVVVIGGEQADVASRHKVIDGQQRLATISCLCRVLLEFAEDVADTEQRRRLGNKLMPCIYADVHGQIHPRLVLNREHEFYKKSVVDAGDNQQRLAYWNAEETQKPAVRTRIVEALTFFMESVQAYLDKAGDVGTEERDLCIGDLVYTLCDLFYGLRIRVDNHLIAYRFFETLNKRGLDLSQSDLIRNVVLEHAETQGQAEHDEALSNWIGMLDTLEDQDRLDSKELIQFSYNSRFKTVKAEKLFDDISSDLRSANISAVSLTELLSMDALYWSDFLRGNKNYWTDPAEESQYFIVNIKPIWKKHAVPLLLRVAERFDNKSSKHDLAKALWAIECFLFREGTINGMSVAELERTMGEAARIVGNSARPADDFVKLFQAESSDNIFKDNFAIATAKGRLAFYIAWRVEKYVLGGGQFDISKLSPAKQSSSTHLEHIMPRKPDASWGGIEDDEDFDAYLDRLGNHLILDRKINSAIKNGSIQNKMQNPHGNKKDYAKQNLKLPQQIVSKQSDWLINGAWNFESITKRQRFLADNYALNVWKIEW